MWLPVFSKLKTSSDKVKHHTHRQWGLVKHLTDRQNGRRAPIYIIKPQNSSQGKGIILTNDLSKIQPGEKCIIQKYIPQPYLLDGYKFDLRIYVLLASVDPLVIYIHHDGLARFATKVSHVVDRSSPPDLAHTDSSYMCPSIPSPHSHIVLQRKRI